MSHCLRIAERLRALWLPPLLLLVAPPALSARSAAELLTLARDATFEVVLPKIEPDHVTYEKPLPLELLPFTERNDPYLSIGTAFAIAPEVFVSNVHVLTSGLGGPMGKPHLRGADGTTYPVEQVLKFSLHQDYVVFRARGARAQTPLTPGPVPEIGTPVYAVGNALGEGVVLRDGLMTSLTPEDQDGRWKWLRFSAAASPGNSGGPLLDSDGHVVGVVTARSPAENLNYALPIEQVQHGSEREGVYDVRVSFGLPILRQQIVVEIKGSMPLPLSWEQFGKQLLDLEERNHRDNTARLLAERAAELPPGGRSGRFLSTLDTTVDFALIGQKADDSWGLIEPAFDEDVDLGDGGKITVGSLRGALGFRWVLEDLADEATLAVRDGKAFMDALLRGMQLPRVVGPQAIRITSLGEPAKELLHTDRFGRIWQQRHWSLGYTDLNIVTLALPTPAGYVGLVSFTPALREASVVASLHLMADYMHVAYSGSMRQWRAFTANRRLCPPFLRDAAFGPDSGVRLALTGLDVQVPSVTLPLDPRSRIVVYTGYSARDGALAAHPAGLTVFKAQGDGDSWLGIWAQPRPTADAGSELDRRWRQMSARQGEFSGAPRNDGSNRVFWTVDAFGDPESGVLYEVKLVLHEQELLPRQMRARRDQLLGSLVPSGTQERQ
jgi:hypothetical protein